MRVHGVDVVATTSESGVFHCSDWYLRCTSDKRKSNPAAFASLVSACGDGRDMRLVYRGGKVNATFGNRNEVSLSLGNAGTATLTSSSLETDGLVAALVWFKVQVNGVHIESTIVCAVHGELETLMFYDSSNNTFDDKPSQSTLKSWGLKLGFNDVTISILKETQIQGRDAGISAASMDKGHANAGELSMGLFLYSLYTKFAVVDIDGTITISDVRGYVESVFLGVYTHVHEGVVRFLKVLEESFGYSLVFLTSRPLAHQEETRLLLANARDFDLDVNGKKCIDHTLQISRSPLFVNLKTIPKAVYGEVIAKSSGDFKSGVMKSVNTVFAKAGRFSSFEDSSGHAGDCLKSKIEPVFGLGVGNKETDMVAYYTMGVPEGRILLVDPSSSIRLWHPSPELKSAIEEAIWKDKEGLTDTKSGHDASSGHADTFFSSYMDLNLLYYLDEINSNSSATRLSPPTTAKKPSLKVSEKAGVSDRKGSLENETRERRRSSILTGPQSNVMRDDER